MLWFNLDSAINKTKCILCLICSWMSQNLHFWLLHCGISWCFRAKGLINRIIRICYRQNFTYRNAHMASQQLKVHFQSTLWSEYSFNQFPSSMLTFSMIDLPYLDLIFGNLVNHSCCCMAWNYFELSLVQTVSIFSLQFSFCVTVL